MSEDEIRPECKAVFGALSDDLREVKGNVKAIYRELLGNGDSKKSVTSRLAILETRREEQRQGGDRFWKVFSVLLAAGTFLIVAFKFAT